MERMGWGCKRQIFAGDTISYFFSPDDSLSSVIILRHLFANNITRLCSAKLILTDAYQTREQVY